MTTAGKRERLHKIIAGADEKRLEVLTFIFEKVIGVDYTNWTFDDSAKGLREKPTDSGADKN